MTKYTVTWRAAAQDELAQLWLASSNRQEITAATAKIDKILGRDALEKGSSISAVSRQLVVDPLRVLFVVRDPDRVVEIFKVAKTQP